MFRKLLLAIGLLFGLIANSYAAIVPTACGTIAATTGATLVLNSAGTVPVDIPAGSIIVIGIQDLSASGAPGGGVVDSAGNSYTNITSALLNGAAANGFISAYYSTTGTAVALTGAGTITYTRGGGSNTRLSISCIYITGGAASLPLDTAVTASATGTAGTITVTSGTPAVSGELFLGLFGNSNANVFTQDTGNGWTSTGGFTAISAAANARFAGGNQVNAGSGTKVYAPTIATANGLWAVGVVGFKPLSGGGAATYRFKSLLGVGQ